MTLAPTRVSPAELVEMVASVESEDRGVDLTDARLYDESWENVVLVTTDGWILRFPREGIAFEREVSLLRLLKGRLPVPIPDVEWTGRSKPFMAYRALTGATYARDAYLAASVSNRDRMTGSWAEFLAAMHTALEPGEITGLGVPSTNVENLEMIDRIRTGIQVFPAEHRPTALALASELEALSTEPADGPSVLLHNDFHHGNFVLDDPVGCLVGVWDFSWVMTGSPSFDFRYFTYYVPDLLPRVARHYAAITGRDIDVRAATVAMRIEELDEVVLTGATDDLESMFAGWLIA